MDFIHLSKKSQGWDKIETKRLQKSFCRNRQFVFAWDVSAFSDTCHITTVSFFVQLSSAGIRGNIFFEAESLQNPRP